MSQRKIQMKFKILVTSIVWLCCISNINPQVSSLDSNTVKVAVSEFKEIILLEIGYNTLFKKDLENGKIINSLNFQLRMKDSIIVSKDSIILIKSQIIKNLEPDWWDRNLKYIIGASGLIIGIVIGSR